MPNTPAPMPTQNPVYGFYGTVALEGHDADTAWTLASSRITDATGADADAIRGFLDSRYGRHFGDDVCQNISTGCSLASAIDAAITRWQSWRTTKADHKQHGIPRGLPFLTAMVHHYEITAA